MKPKLTEAGKLELLAADQEPSLEGSWWIMLQTAESIYNLAVKESRDPVNNAVLSEFWQEVSNAIVDEINPNSVRTLPYDDLMQIISYCGDQLEYVVKNPRHSIVKVDKMAIPYRVRNTGSKTMDWLGKQPGKTIKEKLSGKNKMLTQVNEYTYDVKENQVMMALYRMLMKKVSDRVNQGINASGYDQNKNSKCIDKILRIKKQLRGSELAQVKLTHHTMANNVLLADKNYSVLWKAYLEMCKYDKKLMQKWDKALELYVYALFTALNALLASVNEINVIESRIKLGTESGNRASFILGKDTDAPILIETTYLEDTIELEIDQPEILGISMRQNINKYSFTVNDKILVENIEAKRGCPLNISIKTDKKTDKLEITADMSGIYQFVMKCMDFIQNEYNYSISMDEMHTQNTTGTCALDIVSNGKYFSINNERHAEFILGNTVVYHNEYGEREVYKTTKGNDYSSADEIIYIKDAIGKNLKTEALKNSLEDISKNVTLNMDDYFIYTIPDALEEFSQKSLKQCVNAWFPRKFPVWRSVAALTGIITDKSIDVRPDDIFMSIDLIGETATAGLLTVKYEPAIDNYVCNHYPPFPQDDTGDKITEAAFFKNYLVQYSEKRKLDLDDDAISEIVNSGEMYYLLDESSTISQLAVRNDVSVIKIEFDGEILRNCVDEWLNDFTDFWRVIKRRLSNGIQRINYTNFLSDCILQYINKEDIAHIVSVGESYAGSFVSTSQDISEGAFIYRDRLRGKNLPTWTEYLPKLSLQVTRDGRYEELELIGDDVSFDVMGECNEHPVPEKMMLNAGTKEFRFPLKKEDISRNAAMIEAYVTDKSFPLQENVMVKLMVRYRYGFDNSYELVLKPEDTKNPPFEEIIVEWKEGQRAPKTSRYPVYPELTNYDKVLNDISRVQYKLNCALNTVERFLVNYEYENVCRLDFARLASDMTNQTFIIRNIIIHNEISEVQDFIDEFYKGRLVILCEEIARILHNNNIPDEFFDDFQSNRDFDNLVCSAMQLIYSFGAKTPATLQKYLIDNYETMNVVHKDNILLNMFFMNSQNERIMELVLKESRNYKKMDSCVRELSSLCWFDSKMIYKLSEYPAFIKGIIEYITNELRGKAKKDLTIDPKRMKNQQKRYLRYIEMILAILRLRENEDFDMLIVDSRESRELAEYIRVVDDVMQNPHSKIKLKVNKPEALRNMSDVAYAVDMYLTGNEGVDSIEVISVESD